MTPDLTAIRYWVHDYELRQLGSYPVDDEKKPYHPGTPRQVVLASDYALLEQQVKAHLSIATARVAAADALYEAVTNCRFTTSELKLARLAYKEAAEPKHALAEPHGGDK